MPILSSFKNVSALQIRNNKITEFGCRLIAANMNYLKTIDIRGNKVGDGIIKIIESIPTLKSFTISETGCTNLTAKAIIKYMHEIEMLWCEHNFIDGEHGILIASKKSLRMLSLAGNRIEKEDQDKIKKIFMSKGYVAL